MGSLSPYCWVVLKFVNHFLKSVVINFDDLQIANAHIFQHMHNLYTLLNELVSKVRVTRDECITEPEGAARITNRNMITMGPFSATATHIKESVFLVVVLAVEYFEGLEVSVANDVLQSVYVLYLNSLNVIMLIEADRNCYDQQLDIFSICTPVDLVNLSAVDVVYIFKKHQPRILHRISEDDLTKIMVKLICRFS